MSSRKVLRSSASSASSSSSSVCIEPALILEQAARELDEEMAELREANEKKLNRLLDECWAEMAQEQRLFIAG